MKFKFGDKVKASQKVLDNCPDLDKHVGIVLSNNPNQYDLWDVYWNMPYGEPDEPDKSNRCMIIEWAIELCV